VQRALAELQEALPFRLRGIDSDNGSEFINPHLWDYCQAQEIQFTRGRPYKKDDNAHIEQKNWTHVRKLLGNVRYDTPSSSSSHLRAGPGPPPHAARPGRPRLSARPSPLQHQTEPAPGGTRFPPGNIGDGAMIPASVTSTNGLTGHVPRLSIAD
jgi:hypothetical protein